MSKPYKHSFLTPLCGTIIFCLAGVFLQYLYGKYSHTISFLTIGKGWTGYTKQALNK